MQGVTWGWLCGSHEVSVRVVSALAAAAHKVAVVNDAIASVRTLSMDAISQSVRAEPERGNWNRRACSNSMTPYGGIRSEEHTSELQSLMRISYAVFCLTQTTSHRRTTSSQTRQQEHHIRLMVLR